MKGGVILAGAALVGAGVWAWSRSGNAEPVIPPKPEPGAPPLPNHDTPLGPGNALPTAVDAIVKAYGTHDCGTAVAAFVTLDIARDGAKLDAHPVERDWMYSCVEAQANNLPEPPSYPIAVQGLLFMSEREDTTCGMINDYLANMTDADFVEIPSDWFAWWNASGCAE